MSNFKVGDFVRYIHSNTSKPLKINNINCSRYYFEGTGMSCLEYELIPWTPEPGEWCWFWDEHYTSAILAKFENISNGLFLEHHGNEFEYCEPFIGELPSNLKDL